jgi:PAS domain S-box-containing protein
MEDLKGEVFIIINPREKDNPIVYVDSRFAVFCGYTPEEFIGKNIRFLLQGKEVSQEEAKEIARDALKTRKEKIIEVMNFKKNGTPFINNFKLIPHFDPEDKLIFFVGEHIACYETKPGFKPQLNKLLIKK